MTKTRGIILKLSKQWRVLIFLRPQWKRRDGVAESSLPKEDIRIEDSERAENCSIGSVDACLVLRVDKGDDSMTMCFCISCVRSCVCVRSDAHTSVFVHRWLLMNYRWFLWRSHAPPPWSIVVHWYMACDDFEIFSIQRISTLTARGSHSNTV